LELANLTLTLTLTLTRWVEYRWIRSLVSGIGVGVE
jgi:hypothetical protein